MAASKHADSVAVSFPEDFAAITFTLAAASLSPFGRFFCCCSCCC